MIPSMDVCVHVRKHRRDGPRVCIATSSIYNVAEKICTSRLSMTMEPILTQIGLMHKDLDTSLAKLGKRYFLSLVSYTLWNPGWSKWGRWCENWRIVCQINCSTSLSKLHQLMCISRLGHRSWKSIPSCLFQLYGRGLTTFISRLSGCEFYYVWERGTHSTGPGSMYAGVFVGAFSANSAVKIWFQYCHFLSPEQGVHIPEWRCWYHPWIAQIRCRLSDTGWKCIPQFRRKIQIGRIATVHAFQSHSLSLRFIETGRGWFG